MLIIQKLICLHILHLFEIFWQQDPLIVAGAEYHVVGGPVEPEPVPHGGGEVHVDVDLGRAAHPRDDALGAGLARREVDVVPLHPAEARALDLVPRLEVGAVDDLGGGRGVGDLLHVHGDGGDAVALVGADEQPPVRGLGQGEPLLVVVPDDLLHVGHSEAREPPVREDLVHGQVAAGQQREALRLGVVSEQPGQRLGQAHLVAGPGGRLLPP